MFKCSNLYFVLLVFLMISCPTENDENELGSDQRSDEVDEHMGDDDSCETVSTVGVEWEETTDIGTPMEIFSGLSGSCEAPFVWDGAGWDDGSLTITPINGEGMATVTVELDESSAKLVEQKATEDTWGDMMCDSYMSVDALVTVDILGSRVVSKKKTVLKASKDRSGLSLTLSFGEDAMKKWLLGTEALSIVKQQEDTNIQMIIEMMPVGISCIGEVSLMTDRALGDGTAVGSMGPLGGWSDNGCGMWEESIDLEEAMGTNALQTALIETFDNQTFPGAWQEYEDQQDGDETTLLVEVELVKTRVCVENKDSFEVPVNMTANTSDGIIDNLMGRGSVSVSIDNSAVEYIGGIWASIDLKCESKSDTLPYTPADCNAIESVEAQLGIGNPEENEGDLSLYIYNRQSNTSGAADQVLRLVLDNSR
ncbi:MAG: hypothetical protein GY847_23075 [Proteobacteria bacterium]|nr:hypothetical protein [Pseudomonadota bacterium]